MLRKINLLLLLPFLSLVFGCSDSNELTKQTIKLDINDATDLIVYESPSNDGGRTAAGGTNFYKVTLTGNIEQINFITEDNKQIDPNGTTLQVTSVHPAGDDYIVISGNFMTEDAGGALHAYSTLLVRKSDGVIFDFGAVNINSSPAAYGEQVFQSDNLGNFYYLDLSKPGIQQINVTDPERLSRSSFLPEGQYAQYFALDNYGNCVYQPYFVLPRIRKKSGAIYEFDGTTGAQTFWSSQRGQLYFNGYDNTEEVPTIRTINVDANGDVTTNVVWKGVAFGQNPGVLNLNFPDSYMIRKTNSVVFIALQNGKSFEFFEDESNVVEFPLPDIGGGKLVHSNDYCFVAKDTKLYKISLTDYSYENLLADGQYEVYSMSVSANNTVLINALRFKDGKKIIAEINTENVLSVLEEENDQEAMILQRIN